MTADKRHHTITRPDLAAIVARDAALGAPFDQSMDRDDSGWCRHGAAALDDRRALLVLLRETRDALNPMLNDPRLPMTASDTINEVTGFLSRGLGTEPTA